MLEVREKKALMNEARKQDVSSWQDVDITKLNSKAKKRFIKYRSAIVAYFTTNKPVEEIATRYHLSTTQVLKAAENCLKLHADGNPWGYRALLPGAQVKDQAPESSTEQKHNDEEGSTAPATAEAEVVEQEQPTTVDNDLESTARRPAIKLPLADGVDAVPSPEGVQEQEEQTQLLETDTTVSSASTEAQESIAEISTPTDEIETLSAETVEPEVETTPATSEGSEMSTVEPVLIAEEQTLPTDEADTSHAELPTSALEDQSSTTGEEVTASLATEQVKTEEPPVTEADTIEEPPVAEVDTVEEPQADITEEVIPAQEEPETTAPLEEPAQEKEATAHNDVELTSTVTDEKQSTEVALIPVAEVVPVNEPQFLPVISPHLLPKYAKRVTRSTATKIAQRHRMVRKRWVRDTQEKGHQRNVLRVVSIAIVAAILLGLLIPVGVGLAAYGVYNNVNTMAHSGINHLMTVKDLLPVSKSDPMAALNPQKLAQAQVELKAAETDFEGLQQMANRPDIQSLVQQFAPDYSGKLVMARHLLQVALDVSRMGQELSGIGIIAATIVHSSPLASNTTKPLISVQDIASINAAVVHALYYINDIQQNMSQVQLKDLPVSANQKAQLASVLTQLPTIRDLIVQNQSIIDIVTWLLGVGQPRNFLIQTMDNAELRPGGGFTGQYGVLSVDNGRMGSFSLRDVALLDYAGNGTELGRQAPPAYHWMNFGNWGLRDSNLSGDYPTTARINMQVFQEEGGGPVDGDIAFTPTFIGHIIDITGPIHVADYNETITATNLENRLHYYQQDYNAIAIEHQKANDNSHQARKAFTSLLGKLLLDRVHHLSTKQLLDVIKVAAKDIQSRDLEIYFADPAAEQWLVDHGYSGGLDTFSKQDGFALTQANISISKASQYVHTTEHDDVVLDAQGGATHNLSIILDYNQTGPVYGYDTYSDYMRVYVPSSSQLQSGDGFDSGHSVCTGTGTPNPKPDKPGKTPPGPANSCNTMKHGDTLYCPDGNYGLGTRSYNVPSVVDEMGGPTVTSSDLPGRGMWGGMTVTPKNCTTTILLSWYVPNAVKHNGKHLSYTVFVQKQGGYVPSLELSIDTSAIKGLKPLNFKGNLIADRAFTVSN